MIVEFPKTKVELIEYHLNKMGVDYTKEDGEFQLAEQALSESWIIPREEYDYALIKMRAKVKRRRLSDEKRILEYVNYLNRTYLPNSYYYEDGFLYGEYYLIGRITNSSAEFLYIVTKATSSFNDAIEEDDRFNLISSRISA